MIEVLGAVLGALAVSAATALFIARFMRVGAGPAPELDDRDLRNDTAWTGSTYGV